MILDQEDFIQRSVEKLATKGLFDEKEKIPNVVSLRSDDFSHLYMFEDVPENPLLTNEERTLLRSPSTPC